MRKIFVRAKIFFRRSKEAFAMTRAGGAFLHRALEGPSLLAQNALGS